MTRPSAPTAWKPRRWLAAAAMLLLTFAPASASADWLFTPSLGTTFGADTHGRAHPIMGVALGWLDEEAFGWEADLSFAPDFFEGEHDEFVFSGDSHVGTLMVNALIGVPSADQGGPIFRPYLTGGVGVMQMRAVTEDAEEGGLFESLVHEFGYNIGGGVLAFFGDRFALRADVRYLRSFQNQDPSWTRGIDFDVAPGNFDFFRATAGVTFRFPN